MSALEYFMLALVVLALSVTAGAILAMCFFEPDEFVVDMRSDEEMLQAIAAKEVRRVRAGSTEINYQKRGES